MLYERAMGAAFASLPAPLRRFHTHPDTPHYRGEVTVTHGSSAARLLARAGSMPAFSGTMPFGFRILRDGDTERWEREFDGHLTASRQWLHAPGIVAEQVGGSTFLMAPAPRDGQLHIPIVGLNAFGLPLPRGVLRSCEGIEWVTEEGQIGFDVHASLRGLGLVIRYRGQMAPV
ncbi:DUF4166 domain-containing protein [Gymnodinialimonas sp. 2305UL16-5]|uniref:DUF4166 domain-containing protein n=1 Tax=Gymnodinialimonas mytili TaxID=3126503 RepID=UPI0030B5B213